jgi:hypothetical protein
MRLFQEERDMAKSQRRGNREAKKPKAAKKKPAAAVSVFMTAPLKGKVLSR